MKRGKIIPRGLWALGALLLAAASPGLARPIPGPLRFPIQLPEKPKPGEAPRGAVLTDPPAVIDLAGGVCEIKDPEKASLWIPDPDDVAQIEKRLPDFMRGQKTPRTYKPLGEYYRQYAGFIQDGKKQVCVGFIHFSNIYETLEKASHDPDLFKDLGIGGRPEDYWKRETMYLVDGGEYTFKVLFDPATGSFSGLDFIADE
jgi:hypothetical protein